MTRADRLRPGGPDTTERCPNPNPHAGPDRRAYKTPRAVNEVADEEIIPAALRTYAAHQDHRAASDLDGIRDEQHRRAKRARKLANAYERSLRGNPGPEPGPTYESSLQDDSTSPTTDTAGTAGSGRRRPRQRAPKAPRDQLGLWEPSP